MPNTLFLRLEGPLQSWGERGQWSVRDSSLEPTKSGVIGLVACAFGYAEDEQIRPLSEKTRMGVRVDAPGRLITDYHTIGGRYDYPALLTAEGKPKKTPKGQPHTEISPREYLCDASFLVALQVKDTADAGLIGQMADALQNPIWPIFLGRKSCLSAVPVFAGTGNYIDLETALTSYTGFTRYYRPSRHERDKPFALRLVLETEAQIGRRHRDNVQSRRHRVFHPRYTTEPGARPFFMLHKEDGNVSIQIAAQHP
jgi:CRISPR system Cascade subunit CasD